jgi:hypothetical protein
MNKEYPGTILHCDISDERKLVGSIRQFGNPYKKVRTFTWRIQYMPLQPGTNNELLQDLHSVFNDFKKCWKRETQKMKTGDYSRVRIDIETLNGNVKTTFETF